MKKTTTKKLSLTAMFLAMGVILPFFTGQIPEIGSMLLPMHIPVFLCAFICGWKFSAPMAFILPLLRTLLFGKPNLYPEAVAIAFELCAYAVFAGLIYGYSKQKGLKALYLSLIVSMLGGRAIRGIVQLSLLRFAGLSFGFKAFFAGIVLTGIPGIILQLTIIPAVMEALKERK